MTKFENLTRRAKSIIFEIFSDGPLTRGAAIDALGGVKADETSIEAAREYIASINAEKGFYLYCVEDAIKDADPFDYGDESLERRLLDCYGDHVLGLFPTDAASAAAAEALQMADDAKAEELGKEVRGEGFMLEGGPAYCNHIFKWTADGLEPVEL